MRMKYLKYDSYLEEDKEIYFDVECPYCESKNIDEIDDDIEYIDATKYVKYTLICNTCNAKLEVSEMELEIFEY